MYTQQLNCIQFCRKKSGCKPCVTKYSSYVNLQEIFKSLYTEYFPSGQINKKLEKNYFSFHISLASALLFNIKIANVSSPQKLKLRTGARAATICSKKKLPIRKINQPQNFHAIQ